MPSFAPAVHAKAIQLDKLVLEACADSGSGHPTTAMSLGHIVTVLMYHAMRWSPDQPKHPGSDRLVLSEGHAVPIVYAAYADLGGMIGKDDEQQRPATLEDLNTLRDLNSVFDGHPNPMEGVPFFDAATGSLGQGLSVAAGLAIAAKLDNIEKRIYCIIGDGESREGQIWEAIDLIADLKLAGVLPIFNCNQYGQSAAVSPQQSPETITAKLQAAGITVINVDGHDPNALRDAFEKFTNAATGDQPLTIVATTIKGWGAACIQGNGWHGKPATDNTLRSALNELDEQRVRLVTGIGTSDMQFSIYPPLEVTPKSTAEIREIPSFREAMHNYDMDHILARGILATRKAYGIALRTLGKCNTDVVALDGDVSNSTFSELFAKDSETAKRYIECRIAEQNLFSVGAGLSAAGKIPFCSTFAKFVTRAYDQIEMAINSGANLKIVGSHAGISLAADGPSQMALPDVAWFRSFTTMKDHRGNPGCYILQPADAFAAYALTAAMADYEGVCYMRTLRPDTEFLYDDSNTFNLGGMEVLVEGRDLLIAASGYMVHEANKALEKLDQAGIDATLVDLYSLPFDSEHLLDIANNNGGMVLSIEDNYGGGFGSAIADALAEDGGGFTLEQMFVRRIPKSARNPEEILRSCGLHYEDIVKKACNMLQVATV